MNKDDVSIIIMIVASIILAYYLTMTLILRKNSTHQRNKLYQSLLMGAWMGLIMILLMFYTMENMHAEHKSKYITAAVVLVIVIIALSYMIREQKTINQEQFMLGMIEHHQMAIDMANLVRPKITDPRLETLVSDIITSQSGEIDDMYSILRSRGVYNEPRSLFI